MIVLLVTIVMIILSFLFKKSKFVYLLDFIWMYFLIVYAGNNLADRSIYKMKYLYVNEWNTATEFAFNKFMIFCVNFGFDFEHFLKIYILCFLLIIYFATYRFTENICAVIGFYYIFFFCMDAVQLRFSMASAVAVLAFTFIYAENIAKKDYIIFVLLIILSAGFHIAAAFFLLFFIIPKIDLKKCCYIAGIAALLCIVMVQTSMAERMIEIFLGHKIAVIRQEYGILRIMYTIFRMLIIFLQYYLFYFSQKRKNFESVYSGYRREVTNREQLMEYGLKMNILILSSIALLPFSVDWYRVQQPLKY